MDIRRGKCGGCGAGYTAYDGGCVVVRMDSDTPKGTCRADACVEGQTCPILRVTSNIKAPPPVDIRVPKLTENDRRVFSALTQDFATPSEIAVRARLPRRTRADLADEICSKLARYGLVESASARQRRVWRLRVS